MELRAYVRKGGKLNYELDGACLPVFPCSALCAFDVAGGTGSILWSMAGETSGLMVGSCMTDPPCSVCKHLMALTIL